MFGVIFALDPIAAAAELARATATDGRIVVSAWLPCGAIVEINRIAAAAVVRALEIAPPPSFAWHDREALAGLFGPLGFTHVELARHSLAFMASSARAYLDAQNDSHPLAVAGRAILDATGQLDDVHAEMLAVLEAANEVPAAFAVTADYVVADDLPLGLGRGQNPADQLVETDAGRVGGLGQQRGVGHPRHGVDLEDPRLAVCVEHQVDARQRPAAEQPVDAQRQLLHPLVVDRSRPAGHTKSVRPIS